jgi:predicted AlkP superfamily phosphohydrolase/phosphomutase
MEKKLTIIGIDSLDPYQILKNKEVLPNFSKLLQISPTLKSESIFPTDTIPAWATIYTGLKPENHGLVYIYDIFDPNLSDLNKLNVNIIQGHTFWDYLGDEGYKTAVIFPMLMYPPWKNNGIMISKSPFEKRINDMKTRLELRTSPKSKGEKYGIPPIFENLWGGYPGNENLRSWSDMGKKIILREKKIGMDIFENESWDLFFIYFSLLDIVQHRIWRFFDRNDPTYPGRNPIGEIILEYYQLFDKIIGEFCEKNPEMQLMIVSDHGHKVRPLKSFNINEFLRRKNLLSFEGGQKKLWGNIRKYLLDTANKLDIEPFLLKIMIKNKKLTQLGKSFYSSSGLVDMGDSLAFLSNFAGIKSYSYGGIEINKDLVSESEYESIRQKIINSFDNLKNKNGVPIINFVGRREEVFPGKYTYDIFPDIVFELIGDYCVGWDINNELFGHSYDHKIASGGHRKEAVFLTNIKFPIPNKINIMDIAPSILDYFNLDTSNYTFDGKSFLS